MVIIYFVTGLNGLGFSVPVNNIIPVLVGLLFVVMGNYMSKIKPNWFMGNLMSDTENGDAKVIFVCDENGKPLYTHFDKVRIVSVDGKSPSELLEGL